MDPEQFYHWYYCRACFRNPLKDKHSEQSWLPAGAKLLLWLVGIAGSNETLKLLFFFLNHFCQFPILASFYPYKSVCLHFPNQPELRHFQSMSPWCFHIPSIDSRLFCLIHPRSKRIAADVCPGLKMFCNIKNEWKPALLLGNFSPSKFDLLSLRHRRKFTETSVRGVKFRWLCMKAPLPDEEHAPLISQWCLASSLTGTDILPVSTRIQINSSAPTLIFARRNSSIAPSRLTLSEDGCNCCKEYLESPPAQVAKAHFGTRCESPLRGNSQCSCPGRVSAQRGAHGSIHFSLI